MVRLPAQKLLDTACFPVAETECAMERLFRDLRQAAILAGKEDD